MGAPVGPLAVFVRKASPPLVVGIADGQGWAKLSAPGKPGLVELLSEFGPQTSAETFPCSVSGSVSAKRLGMRKTMSGGKGNLMGAGGCPRRAKSRHFRR